MFLKNYTSEVPVAQTIARIEKVLIKCGVSGITKEYADSDGKIAALTFQINLPGKPPITIRMPADEKAAQQALWLNYADGDTLNADGSRLAWNARKKLTKADFLEQAQRTAWRIVQDWVEVQLSMIQLGQADFVQVFLPYVLVDGARTYYQALVESNFQNLLPEKTS